MDLQLVSILSATFVIVTAAGWSVVNLAASLQRSLANTGSTQTVPFVRRAKSWLLEERVKIWSVMTRILNEPSFQGDWAQSPVRRRLIQAGLRSKDSFAIYLFAKFS